MSTPRPEADTQASTVDWEALPEPIRLRLAEFVAQAVGELPAVEVPQQLRQVAKFAPAKRASLGGRALLGALRDLPEFREAVCRWGQERDLSSLDATDPTTTAAVAIVLNAPDVQQHILAVQARVAEAQLRAERDAALAKVDRLEAEVEQLKLAVQTADSAAEQASVDLRAEVERLRKRVREQNAALRESKERVEIVLAEGKQIRTDAEAEIAALTADRDRERHRAEAEHAMAQQAMQNAETARQSAREARKADEVRLALLVDTIEGAVTGLRGELAIGGTGPRPADLVRGASATHGVPAQARDLTALDRLLALPRMHLIVDGYNVTKTGYPQLSLADQRDRLARQLSVLAARTGAEVTVVFDGAGVVAVPPSGPRGVRVLFSEPDVLADDVIRAIVTAEPEGRPMLVVTSDRAVVESTRRSGAYSASSALLIKRLMRV